MLRHVGGVPVGVAVGIAAATLAPGTAWAGTQTPGWKDVRVQPWAESNHLARRLYSQGEAEAGRRLDRERAARRASRRLLRRAHARPVKPLGASAKGFIWPVNDGINSPFGPRWGGRHTGIDIDGDAGRLVGAAKAGVIVRASDFGGYGLTVSIDHGGDVTTLYGHLSRIAVGLGEEVEQGDVIGRIGCTGNCTGNHLHFEIQVGGVPRRPANFLP
jgi:murein DD-endopeptidase MepM/ murein hydrolase activator NlpD